MADEEIPREFISESTEIHSDQNERDEFDDIFSKDDVDSLSDDEVSNEGTTGATTPLMKGPWTPTEDVMLVDYVDKHGEGDWNKVHKLSRLARCGKSCRLRWANHLRPNLKKGAFTPEEERRVIELHAKIGNKWARMVKELPGRTDNEIKNYWNTRVKRRERAGLPVYPPDICPLNDNQHAPGNIQHHDLIPANLDFPDIDFSNHVLNSSEFLEMPDGSLLDMRPSRLLDQILNSSYTNKSLFSPMHPSKRLRASELLLPRPSISLDGAVPFCSQYPGDGSEIGQSLRDQRLNSSYTSNSVFSSPMHPSKRQYPGDGSEIGQSLLDQRLDSSYTSNSVFLPMHPSKRLRPSELVFPPSDFSLNGAVPVCSQYPGDGSEIGQSFLLPSAYDHNLPPDHMAPSLPFQGNHAFINRSFPPSEPTSWATELEFPSIQNQIGNWGYPASPLPSLDSVDTLLQPPPTEQTGSGIFSPQNSGLLDVVLHESKAIKNSKNTSHQNGVFLRPGALMDDTLQDFHYTEWEAHGDPTSPFGHSARPMFKNSKNTSHQNADSLRPGALRDDTFQDFHYTEWEAPGDPTSPFGHSAGSMFKNSNNTSHQSGVSLRPGALRDDTSQDVHYTEGEAHGYPTCPFGHSAGSMFNSYNADTTDSSGWEFMQDTLNADPLQSLDKNDRMDEVIDSRPDSLLGSNIYSHPGKK